MQAISVAKQTFRDTAQQLRPEAVLSKVVQKSCDKITNLVTRLQKQNILIVQILLHVGYIKVQLQTILDAP